MTEKLISRWQAALWQIAACIRVHGGPGVQLRVSRFGLGFCSTLALIIWKERHKQLTKSLALWIEKKKTKTIWNDVLKPTRYDNKKNYWYKFTLEEYEPLWEGRFEQKVFKKRYEGILSNRTRSCVFSWILTVLFTPIITTWNKI